VFSSTRGTTLTCCAAPLLHTTTGVLTCGAYSYSGEWVDDEMNGQGRFTFASGARYEGTLLHNAFHGQGSYCWPDGKQYAVRWLPQHRTARHSTAPCVLRPAQSVCALCCCKQGAWVHNVMHGTGVITDTQGHRWTGRFFNGAGPGLTCEL
jgi:hypothetical protein